MVSVAVVGAGYVGLVTAAGLAHLGHSVVCQDRDHDKIATLQAGRLPIFEEGLLDLVQSGMRAGRLRFVAEHDDHSAASSIWFLCVATPQAADGSADLSYLEAAAREIAPMLPVGSVVVNKSTVPVGSASVVAHILQRSDVHVVSNPEFLREGTAVNDFLHPDRIVVGATNQDAGEQVAALYDGVATEIVLTDPASAELIKYASNAFLATKLSFMNAVAAICEGHGADVADVRIGMGLDQRIGLDFMNPGPGWGGSCFPKDTQAMLHIAASADVDFALVRQAIVTNEWQIDRVVAKIEQAIADRPAPPQVALLGLSFKAGTDDTRMSPALEIAKRLVDRGAAIVGYDPVARVDAAGMTQVDTVLEACAGADVVVVATEWDEFTTIDFGDVANVMRGNTVVDTRRILNADHVECSGLALVQIGRS